MDVPFGTRELGDAWPLYQWEIAARLCTATLRARRAVPKLTITGPSHFEIQQAFVAFLDVVEKTGALGCLRAWPR